MLYFFGAEGLGEGGALWKIPVKNTADRFLCLMLNAKLPIFMHNGIEA